MLDIEPESEDEDAIIERRRQLRQAIVQKYNNNSQTPTEVSSINPSPAPPSEADSDAVGDEAAKDLEETIQQEEIKLKMKLSESKEVCQRYMYGTFRREDSSEGVRYPINPCPLLLSKLY